MKLTRLFFLMVIVFIPLESNALTVPFQNIILAPNKSLTASYAFGTHPLIYCLAQSNTTLPGGILQWPNRGTLPSATLPVTLTVSTQFQGQLADASGTITITNNQKINLQVNCVFTV